MKTIKYFVIGAMLVGAGAPAMAQDKAAIDQVKSVLNAGLAAKDADKQVSNIAKPFKKDAATLTAIGREYFTAKNYAKASEYAKLVTENGKLRNYGPAWELLADVEIMNDNPGAAAQDLQLGIVNDASYTKNYVRYAKLMMKSSPADAIGKLKELGQTNPSYPWQAEAAEIYDDLGKIDEAIEYYSQCDVNALTEDRIGSYATDLFFANKYDKSIEVAKAGLKKAPRNPTFNRVILLSASAAKDYATAVEYADRLFNASDDAKIIPADYKFYAISLKGEKKYAEAVEAFNNLYNMPEASKAQKEEALKSIADTYADMEDFQSSLATYEKYLAEVEEAKGEDYAAYAAVYMYKAQKEEGEEKAATIQKAINLYGEIGQKFPELKESAVFQCARMSMTLDPKLEQGLAKPYYDQLIEMIAPEGANMSNTSKSRIIQAYHFNMSYSLMVKKDVAEAKAYAAKILEIDPEYKQALEVSNM